MTRTRPLKCGSCGHQIDPAQWRRDVGLCLPCTSSLATRFDVAFRWTGLAVLALQQMPRFGIEAKPVFRDLGERVLVRCFILACGGVVILPSPDELEKAEAFRKAFPFLAIALPGGAPDEPESLLEPSLPRVKAKEPEPAPIQHRERVPFWGKDVRALRAGDDL